MVALGLGKLPGLVLLGPCAGGVGGIAEVGEGEGFCPPLAFNEVPAGNPSSLVVLYHAQFFSHADFKAVFDGPR